MALKRTDRENYHAFGGDIGFLFERLHGWIVDVRRVNGTVDEVVVAVGYDNDGNLVGYPYDSGEEAGLFYDSITGTVGRAFDPLSGVGVTTDEPVRIPWTEIDVVEVN